MNESHYTIVTQEQGTPEWLAWRQQGIGASDASSIMGESRFKSAEALLHEKRSKTFNFSQNEAMAKGVQLEPVARRRYIETTGIEMHPICLQSTRYEWLRASLDGISINHDAVVEIKCGASAYRHAAKYRDVPVYYYGQLQHILAITDLASLDFWCFWPGSPEILIPVLRNEPYIEYLLEREADFWSQVISLL